MPEISDADNELLELAKVAVSGKHRMAALRVFKEASPEALLPEVDTADRISEAVNPLKEENKKLRDDLEKERAVSSLEKKRDALRAKGIDVTAVEKVMLEKGITSHESAAEFLALNTKPAPPATPSWDRSATIPQNEGLKKNPKMWAREEAARVITEIAANKK